MFESVREAVAGVRSLVGALDPALLTGSDAAAGVAVFAELERLAAAGRTLLAKRVDETGAWVGSGQRSMATWMADQAGTSVGAAIAVTQTSWQLDSQPSVADAMRSGRLSPTVAGEISSAAAVAPESEADLVSLATRPGTTVKTVREKCVAVRAGAADERGRAERDRARTTFRTWTERDGMVGFSALYPPLIGASMRAAIEQRAEKIYRLHRRERNFESRDKYSADALAEFVTGAGEGAHPKGRTRANVRIRVDLAALRRGHVEAGEKCEAEGAGPIAVAEVVDLIATGDPIVEALLTDGVDVLRVRRLDRYITPALRTALEFRDEKCVVDSCDQRGRLEIDHTEDFGKGNPTEYRNLKRMCDHHHRLKTRYNWRLVKRDDGTWDLVPPPDTS